MTIDVALLRQLAAQPNTKVREDFTELALKSIGTVLLKPTTVTELLDAYEERDRLRAALLTIERGADHPLGIVGAPAFYEAMEWASTIANAALEGRE